MILGVPKETKESEDRVALVPAGVHELVEAGHRVLVEKGAGAGSGIRDEEFAGAGATLARTPREVFESAELVVKVKEPLPAEYPLVRPGQTLFTYFHFAASRTLTDAMAKSGAICLAYETLEVGGHLPLLTPMSEVAGRMSVHEGAKYLERAMGGRGVLLAGVPGVEPADVLVVGGGVVGSNAARIAAGMGARVTIMDVSLDRLRFLAEVMPANVTTLFSTPYAVRERARAADLFIGAVLISGKRAPVLLRKEDVSKMRPGSVIVDVAVDQGGCVETCRPTTHRDPTFVVDGVVHYCVANMPGAVARTSTYALTNATLPWVRKLAAEGPEASVRNDPSIRSAANVVRGQVTHPGVAESFGLSFVPPEEALRPRA
ncbi:MAG TPA: alanine dehydrogenase [Planctomycetota bacterium]|nr:alanine dehydrogenase [Planctomycetota bacterium]